MQKFRKGLKKVKKKVTSYDIFGTPVTVNFKGEDTYKTLFGAIVSLSLAALMLYYTWIMFGKMVDRSDPDLTSYKLVNSRTEDDPLIVPEHNGQLYVGLSETVEYSDGTKITSYIEMDPRYINVKIDYYVKSSLDARKDLNRCDSTELETFALQSENSNAVTSMDFDVLRCIPRDKFKLYNEA